MDPLEELPVEQWPILRDKVKSLWPMNVGGYYALDTSIKNALVREKFEFKVYCPYGDMDNGYVATCLKSPVGRDILIIPVSQDTSKLEEAVINTKLLDWSLERTCINLVSSFGLKMLYRIKPAMGFCKFEVGPMQLLFLDKISKKSNVSCPPDTHLAPVREEHIKHVNEVWYHAYEGSQSYFSKLAACGLSYGLYYKDELAAWVFSSKYKFIRHLYCEGYGKDMQTF